MTSRENQGIELNHWHPVLKVSELGISTKKIKILETEIVIFKNNYGRIMAVDDVCIHRRMSLSLGKVNEGCLACPYHGWRYDGEGGCYPASNPDSRMKTEGYEVVIIKDVIWIRKQGSSSSFPVINPDGLKHISTDSILIQAPLEIVLDNFTETEHTSSVHAFLGYDKTELKNAEVELTQTNESVRLFNKAKQKKVPWIVRYFLKIDKNDEFVDDWTTYFSPVYTIYDQYWIDHKTKNKRENYFKIYVYFNEIDKNTTQLFVFTYLKYPLFGNFGLNLLIKPAMKKIVRLEVSLDKKMIEKIADKSISLKGAKLSRFDRALGPNREKIEKIYREKS